MPFFLKKDDFALDFYILLWYNMWCVWENRGFDLLTPEKTRAQLIDAIRESGGIIQGVAGSLGVTRQAIYKRIRGDKELEDELFAAREKFIDVAESVLQKKVTDGDNACLIFFLKTQAKKRGYVERQEFQHETQELKMYGKDAPVEEV